MMKDQQGIGWLGAALCLLWSGAVAKEVTKLFFPPLFFLLLLLLSSVVISDLRLSVFIVSVPFPCTCLSYSPYVQVYTSRQQDWLYSAINHVTIMLHLLYIGDFCSLTLGNVNTNLK